MQYRFNASQSAASAGSSPITISFKNARASPSHAPDQPPNAAAESRVRRPHAAFTDEDEAPAHAPPDLAHKGKEKKDKDKDKDKDKSKKAAAAAESDKDSKSAEEKRKHIKSLIDKIPTQKEQLFQYKLDAAHIDAALMDKKIRPWINKKIIEYIGEPEPTLVDFICSKVLAGSAPQGILDDVQMVLDEEAEVFVVKMWRLLIYELEAKRAGLHK
ncbi:RNA-binding protein 25-like [Ostrinia furnacalis]|uniref:RNA-binding protein 25-like n=1 Tax=Ostrinia furnacalis TaxID=93504 RepID=UPI00103BFEAD|nr:RNA-binding protein 25-like [Ostrinia furnacalis]